MLELMSRTTVRNYLRQDEVMEQRQAPHHWRTREDQLEADWPQELAMLREAPWRKQPPSGTPVPPIAHVKSGKHAQIAPVQAKQVKWLWGADVIARIGLYPVA